MLKSLCLETEYTPKNRLCSMYCKSNGMSKKITTITLDDAKVINYIYTDSRYFFSITESFYPNWPYGHFDEYLVEQHHFGLSCLGFPLKPKGFFTKILKRVDLNIGLAIDWPRMVSGTTRSVINTPTKSQRIEQMCMRRTKT